MDQARIALHPNQMYFLQSVIAVMMFGVSLELVLQDVLDQFQKPQVLLLSLISQWILFPSLVMGLGVLLNLHPSLVLGLGFVVACPSGNLANVFTSLASGHLGQSLSIVSSSTLLSVLSFPIILSFFSSQQGLSIPIPQILSSIFFTLFLPILMGLGFQKKYKERSEKLKPYLKKFSFGMLLFFILSALIANRSLFFQYAVDLSSVVFGFSFLFFTLTWGLAQVIHLDMKRMIAFVLGNNIKNTALGLALVLQFFPEKGGASLIVALYGVAQLSYGFFLIRFKDFVFKKGV